jgi:hypothetical protein
VPAGVARRRAKVVSASASAWHDRVVYLVLLAAALAILAGVVVVAMGRGGELVAFDRDLPLVPPPIRTAADVAMLRLPIGLFGYRQHSADAALDAAARLVAERDAEVEALRAELWRLSQRSGVVGGDRGNGGLGGIGQPEADVAEPDETGRDETGQDGTGPFGSGSGATGSGPSGAAGEEIVSTHGQAGGQAGGQS